MQDFKYFSSNISFAPRIIFPQAVTLDFDNPFLSRHYEMALIQQNAHDHIQHKEYCSEGQGLASRARQTDKSKKRNDNIGKEAVQAKRLE